jgi:excisionase family DNA binding protein
MVRYKAKDESYPKAYCEHCNAEFPMRREWAKFCSDRCRVAHSELDKAIRVVNRYLATVNEAAQVAGVSVSTIRRWAERGKVRTRKHVGRVCIYREDVQQASN